MLTTKYYLATVALGFVLTAAATAPAQLDGRVIVSGLSSPLDFAQDPADASVQFVVERGGRIRVIKDGKLLARNFIDLSAIIRSGGEQGLLGLAFDPDASSGRFYVNFTNRSGDTVIARFKRSKDDPLIADPDSRFDLRWGGPGGLRFIDQPFGNHNGGHIAFGPDGFLYIGMGDGGSGGDPGNRAQNPNTRLGKMLRIDVNVPDEDPEGYRVPPDNPFLAGDPIEALPEIWAFGVRNPWRFEFDNAALGGTGALVIADVGQNAWEEIDYEPAGRGGRNYGWRNREGAHPFNNSREPAYRPLIDPIHEYNHTVGRSISGGFVYRGSALGCKFLGRYFYADFVNRRVWSIKLTIDPDTGEATASDEVEHTAELGGGGAIGNIAGFGEDAAGELYLLSFNGRVIKIVGGCNSCDTNCDGSVDLTDVEPFIDLLLEGDGCSKCAGDVNCDGSIDLTDVEGFIDCLLG